MPNNPTDPDRKPVPPDQDPTPPPEPPAPGPDSWADIPVAGMSGSEEIDLREVPDAHGPASAPRHPAEAPPAYDPTPVPEAPAPAPDSWADIPVAGMSGSEEIDLAALSDPGGPASAPVRPAAAPPSDPSIPVASPDSLSDLNLDRSDLSGASIPVAAADSASDLNLGRAARIGSPGVDSSGEIIPEALPSESSIDLRLPTVRPVAPVSGWLGSRSSPDLPPPTAPADADVAAAPRRTVESSDVFADQYPPPPPVTEGSDVIAGSTADEVGGSTPRSSEIALLFEPAADGSTLPADGPVADLPLAADLEAADDFPEADSLFDLGPAPELPFGPVGTPPPPADVPDYGATPVGGLDASSILGDLMGEPDRPEPDGSAVRIEDPGIGRTFPDAGGTEFDLTPVDDLPVPPELADAADAADGAARTSADLGLHDPDRADLDRTDEQPAAGGSVSSSIFAGPGSKPKTSSSDVTIGGSKVVPAEDDSSVEFSDHPSAEDEAAASRIFGPPSPARPPRPRPPAREPDPIAGMLDWGADEADVLGADPAAAGGPPTGVLSERRKGPAGGAGAKPPSKVAAPADAADESDPSVEIDWLSGSSAEEPVVAEVASGRGVTPVPAPRPKPRPAREREPVEVAEPPARGGAAARLGGALVGAVVAAGVCAGVYFGGLVPNSEPTTQAPVRPDPKKVDPGKTEPPVRPAAVTPAAVTAAVRAGDLNLARELASSLPEDTTAARAAVGEAELFAAVQVGKPGDGALKAAREKLQGVVDATKADATADDQRRAVKAAVQVGIAHELAGDAGAARKAYEDGKAKFPKHAATFDAALDRLAVTTPAAAAPDGTSRRLDPADARQLLLAVVLLQKPPPPPDPDEPEAGVYFWKAVNRAAAEKFGEAAAEIERAKAAHLKQAKRLAGRGLNPLSDPLEQIFARSCDDLKAYWELKAAIYGNKPVADLFQKEGAANAVAALAKNQDAAGKVAGLTADLKDTSDKLATFTKELKDTSDKLAVAMKELKVAGDAATDLKAEVKKADEAKAAAEKSLVAEEKARVAAAELVAAVAKELQGAKLLGEKYTPEELRAAQKAAAERATGPTLSTLLPSGMVAVGGGGLSAAQLLDVSNRLTRAEAAARAADEKLAAETKKLTADHAVAMKKLADAHATAVGRLKDDQTAELKAAADKYAAEAKKLTDGFEAKAKLLELAAAREKERAAVAATQAAADVKRLEAQIAADKVNALSPAEALDLWLPILVELRRPADADGAREAAGKVLKTRPADSPDAGKAHAVNGLALLLKGDDAGAKAELEAARANPAYPAAARAKALWATATEVGLASVGDRLAAFRRPAEGPRRDPVAAARALDAGITAYKGGRYGDAAGSLTAAVEADPTEPLGWYFLGAARWALGSADQARDDFRQGAARELSSTVPTRVVNAALAPIQGPARDALTAARP